MNKFLLLLALVASSLQAGELANLAEHTQLAMGDIGSVKSSLSAGGASDMPMQNMEPAF